MSNNNIIVRVATSDDKKFAEAIVLEMEESAKARGTGIAKRSPDYLKMKMDDGKAVIALTEDDTWVGFCYIEAWEHEKYVANSGLIVSPAFRKTGVATEIKQKVFELSRRKYPDAKIFGLTTGLAVMKINSDLGYEPVTYSELTHDEVFWKGCQSCVNYEILISKEHKNCMCTAMLYDPVEVAAKKAAQAPALVTVDEHREHPKKNEFRKNYSLFERFVRLKQFLLLQTPGKENEDTEKKGDKGNILNFILGLF